MNNIQPGQMLGPYRIISQIGQGGMATVYKAYHAAIDRYVAVKVLPGEFAKSPEFMGRFQQEARTIANLEHPHILPVHDFGESGGVHYLVMRFLDTGTLKERIEAGPLLLPEIDRIFSQLADALGYAHERGVIHRDLKPSNVLVDSRGGVFLTDFGIAKIMEGASKFTTTGAITGTPAYMSPEQAQGEKIDRRSDIYSLGIVLYEMVTGRVPFEAETPLAVILKHVQAPLPLPSSLKPGLAPDIERVLLKALTKDRNDRFATCQEFLDAWRFAFQAAAGVPPAVVTSATVKTPERAPTVMTASLAAQTVAEKPKPPQRAMPVLLIAGGLLLAALVVVGLVVVAGILVTSQILTPVPGLPSLVPGGTTTSVAAATATTPPKPGATPVPPPSLENATFTSWTAGNVVYHVAIDDDQLITSGPGGVTVWNRADGSILRRITTANGLPAPDVTALFVDSDRTLWIGTDRGLVHADGETLTFYTVEDGLDSDAIRSVSRLRDGRLIVGTHYSGFEGGGLNMLDGQAWKKFPDFPSATPEEKPAQLANFVNAVLDEGEGGAFWVATTNGLGRFDGSTWTRFAKDTGLPCNNIYTLYRDSQGRLIVGAECGGIIYDGQAFETLPQGPPYGVYGIAESPPGRYWFSGGGGVWRFDSAKADWKEFSQETNDLPTYTAFGAASDPDGNVYVGADDAGVIVFSGGQEITTWSVPNVPSAASLGSILVAPDGKLWFGEEYGGSVDVFDPQTETWGEVTEELPGFPLRFDSQNNVWLTSWNEGFWVIGNGNKIHISERQGLPTDYQVRDVDFTPDGAQWIATTGGLAVFDGEKVTQILKAADTGLPTDFIRTMYAAQDGSLWVSGETGLSRRMPDGEWEQFGVGNPFDFEGVQVWDIAEDGEGRIWIGTNGEGIYRYAAGEWEHFTSGDPDVDLPSSEINSITVAPDGSLWFGTHNGAARLVGEEWEAIGVGPEALVNDHVNDIYIAEDGAVYFATSGGATRLKP